MFGLFSKKSPIAFDIFEGHPMGEKGRSALLANDWAALEAMYSAQTASDRYHWIQVMGAALPLDHALPDPAGSSPLNTILGGLFVSRAARIRGAGMADTVGEDAALGMFRNARNAFDAFDTALSIQPDDSTTIAWYFRALIAGSDSSGKDQELTEKLHATSETTLFAPLELLVYNTEKWMGSEENMWRIANHYTQSPPNPAWLALKARAFIENHMWFLIFEDDKDRKKQFQDYRYSPAYKDDIAALDAAFWEGLKQDAEKIPLAELMLAHNTLAFLAVLTDAHDLAKRHIEVIGPKVWAMPWGYLTDTSDIMKFWNKTRKRLGLEGYYA